MAERKNKRGKSDATSANVGYETQLRRMADALRGSMDAAGYKHVVLGLIFLEYISDAFEEQHAKLVDEQAQGAHPEDPGEYRAQSICCVPPEACWAHLKAQAKQPTIGKLVDDAMAGIERDNPALEGVLPKNYARPALDRTRLGQLIDLISSIEVGDEEARAKEDASCKLTRPEGAERIQRNRAFHRLLVDGVTVLCRDAHTPEHVSSELPVRDAERFVGGAG